ncbi:hypothetical protein EDD18DRAFT_1362395 [Armillaria luteobubalina]|uniref:Uncharacterized protein n=1 Tax=Armillaria luteobubalina TaxID=153913 RepID=A0AA39PET3_9AGAR|nr:hypothetical protein EDD18DRAFT_1362395 [Armillaria luteobubalina]
MHIHRRIASLSHIVSLPSLPQPPSTLTLHERLCGGFGEERVTHIWTATINCQPIITKIFDPLYFVDPDNGMDPFPLIDFSVYCEVKLTTGSLLSRGNCMVYVLLLEHITGGDVHYLVPDSTIPSLCLAHHTALIDAAVNIFYDILMCSIKQRDMAPCNLIIQPPRQQGAPFCDKGDCPIHFYINPSNVKSVMIDLEGSKLWDPSPGC